MANMLAVLQWLGRTGQEKKGNNTDENINWKNNCGSKESIAPSRGTMSSSFQNEIS